VAIIQQTEFINKWAGGRCNAPHQPVILPKIVLTGVEPASGGLDLTITGCNTMNRALPLFLPPHPGFWYCNGC
ncbi:hypothetical protein, partial [Erwinia sp. S38]|uniref:hypothetical protein n=1 Tax=Erwinia sp. S38 TaxID=2769338 RepID=UPI001F39D675